MYELAKRCDVYKYWDSLCNNLPSYYTIEDVAETFAEFYGVDAEEVKEFFL